MWTPGHGPELRRARPTYGVDDVDEARFNPVCRRARGVEDDSDPSESDTGSDDDDDSHSSECDLVENVRQARLNALRRRRDDREEIRRQNETLERIHRARHAEREMAKELSSMRFEAERRHTLKEHGLLQPMVEYRRAGGGSSLSSERGRHIMRAIARGAARRSPPPTTSQWAQTRDDMVSLWSQACSQLPSELPYAPTRPSPLPNRATFTTI